MTDLITTPHLLIQQYSIFYQFISLTYPTPNFLYFKATIHHRLKFSVSESP
ncbi:hypothetical protein KSS87_023200 [Heliosperma pusillum]|nr:hypothetical protein KSS87_002194 [Heliosperma pusillum]KAH9626709.1 hypothetical protein KSS87_023200 [Heliosperma pusillum]